ncbi:MAG: hypothetical protein IT425_10610 [Pirellulales bacterium]|nr:hypothetical protein [Pirellulales bacterium]
MGLIYYGCGGWARHVNEFYRFGRPIPRRLREGLRSGVEQDRTEIGLIEKAIFGSDIVDPPGPKEAAGQTPRTKRTAKRPAAGIQEASRRKPRTAKTQGTKP